MMRRIDLLPVAYVQRRRDRRNVSIVIAIGLFLVLLMVAWYFYLRTEISTANTELSTVKAQNAGLENQIAELQRFAELDAEVKAKRTALQTVFAGDIDWPAILTEIAMVTPGEVWLDTLQASAGNTEGSTPVDTETNEIRLTQKSPVGRIAFDANSASCMPGVAKWLIRLASVEEFDAAWIGSASESDSRPGCEPPVIFNSTLELNDNALSHRFEGELE
jgi:Tfp pilus assembly protein PilN